MYCEKAQELFSEYVAGSLDSALVVTVENHLAACAGCREEVVDLRQVWQMLDGLPCEEPPPYFHENLMSRIASEIDKAETAARRSPWDLRSLLRGRTFAYAVAAVLLLLACVEVVRPGQTASLGPLGWLPQVIRKFVRPAAPSAPLFALQTATASSGPVLPDGSKSVVVRLRPLPLPDNRVNTLRAVAHVAEAGGDEQSRTISSNQETVLTLPLRTPGADAVAVSITLRPLESTGAEKTLVIPLSP